MATSKATASTPLLTETGSAAPSKVKSLLRRLKKNLFASPGDALLTIAITGLLVITVPRFLDWAFFDATFWGTSRDACQSDGACWVFVRVRFNQFLFGFYPEQELWRVLVTFFSLVVFALPLFVGAFPYKRGLLLAIVVLFPPFAWAMLYGGAFGLAIVETPKWGGLMLTLIIAGVGITASLPFGILLALARRSTTMPLVRQLSILFIELWRGVPLITVLFMSSVMLPLFLPEGLTFDKLLRALTGVTLFSAAYMAEVVRGGLQAIPKGQFEAAESLGLSYPKVMVLVTLPQALKLVIPGIVNTFIGLFKDTTLVLIIGMFDLLGIVQAAATDPNWLGFAVEGYVFAGMVFWLFCFTMSRFSQRLEARLHTSGGSRK